MTTAREYVFPVMYGRNNYLVLVRRIAGAGAIVELSVPDQWKAYKTCRFVLDEEQARTIAYTDAPHSRVVAHCVGGCRDCCLCVLANHLDVSPALHATHVRFVLKQDDALGDVMSVDVNRRFFIGL